MAFDYSKMLKPSSTHAGRIDWVRTADALGDYFARMFAEGSITHAEYSESVGKIPYLVKYLKRRKHYLLALKREGKR
jgi:hypothetical protein